MYDGSYERTHEVKWGICKIIPLPLFIHDIHPQTCVEHYRGSEVNEKDITIRIAHF